MGIARASGPYLAVTLGLAALLVLGWYVTGWRAFGLASVAAGLLVPCFLWFFRDPARRVPADPLLVLSPADGIVQKVHPGRGTRTIEIFLRIWDVHIQRAPAAGEVREVRRFAGGFLPANAKRAGSRNLRAEITMRTHRGTYRVTQVAGLIARRVDTWVRPGRKVARGERIGIIHMGSQCRLEIPAGARILIAPGQKVYGGLTPVATWRK